MGKYLILAAIGLGVWIVIRIGASARRKELAARETRKAEPETLVYDEKKRAYVPRKRR